MTFSQVHAEMQRALPHMARPTNLPHGYRWIDWREFVEPALRAMIWAGTPFTDGVAYTTVCVTLWDLLSNPSARARLDLSEAQIEISLAALADG